MKKPNRRGRPLVGIVLTGLAALLAVRGAAGTEAGRLVVRSTSLATTAPDDEGMVTVRTDLAWTAEEFPGVYTCTWTVRGDDGSVVGTYEDEVISLWSEAPPIELTVPVRGPAATASGECSATRLDVGGSYEYEFSDVRVAPVQSDEAEEAGYSAATVSIDAKWLGAGHPGPVTCTLEVRDADGAIIVTEPMNILFADGTYDDYEFTVESPEFVQMAPVEAEVGGCAPFTQPSGA